MKSNNNTFPRHITAANVKEAWRIADSIFPTDYMHDGSRTERAGYDVFTSTASGVDAWISDLGARLEVNMPDGSTVDIIIDAGASSAPAAPAAPARAAAAMRRAWDIRRAAALEIGCTVSAVDMSACLRMAWSEIGTDSARTHADNVRREWARLSPEKQRDFCARSVNRAARFVIGISEGGTDKKPAYAQAWEKPAFAAFTADLGDYHDETFARVLETLERLDEINARRAEWGGAPQSLRSIVFGCAKAAVMQIYRAEAKHASALRYYTDENGAEQSFVETVARAERENTERDALLTVSLSAFRATLDSKTALIFDVLSAGGTQKDAARALDCSAVAVHKRVEKMRAAWMAFNGGAAAR